jgi:RNA polymerase sigma factor (sigma-70 family)
MQDEAAAAEAGYRPLLFSIAYGMTGSAGDAEDIVQDAFAGLARARRAGTAVQDPRAYLATAVTTRGITHLSSARVRRERHAGDWLPEPVVVPAGAGPAELADSLSMAFLVLLEALSPAERAVFMLREVFGYGYQEVAAMTGRTAVNCRHIFARARQRIATAGPPRGGARPTAGRELPLRGLRLDDRREGGLGTGGHGSSPGGRGHSLPGAPASAPDAAVQVHCAQCSPHDGASLSRRSIASVAMSGLPYLPGWRRRHVIISTPFAHARGRRLLGGDGPGAGQRVTAAGGRRPL